MNKAVYSVELPLDLKDAAEKLAELEGVSLIDWVTFAVAQKVVSSEAVAALLRQKAAAASGRDLSYYLDRVPNVVPMPGDELPAAWKRDT